MESTDLSALFLDLLAEPAFSVEAGTIRHVNAAAAQLQIEPGTVITDLIHIGKDAYGEFHQGCLFLTLTVSSLPWGASVTRVGTLDIFQLAPATESEELRAYALAAQFLRTPLSNVITVSDQLLHSDVIGDDPKRNEQASQLNRGLYQLQRLIGNMSDAARYSGNTTPVMEVQNITALFKEILEKAAHFIENAGLKLEYSLCSQDIFSLANRECIERAVYNLLSNAIKFSPANGIIQAKLTLKNNLLCFTLQDQGAGISKDMQSRAFSRFLREPRVEDGRNGIGLGMLLVRSAATAHGGTVLMEQPEGQGLRITMTIAIRQDANKTLRSPLLLVDPWGGRDHGLVELSDALPASTYREYQ